MNIKNQTNTKNLYRVRVLIFTRLDKNTFINIKVKTFTKKSTTPPVLKTTTVHFKPKSFSQFYLYLCFFPKLNRFLARRPQP